MRSLFLGALMLAVSPALAADPAVVYLVRHAEKAPDVADPPLTEVGKARAAALSQLLSEVALVDVFSTDTLRTRSTGAPSAEAHGLKVQLYDPGQPEVMLKAVHGPGAHLVVGHSDTTPALVEALGGVPGKALGELEYDRLYVVFLSENGGFSQLLRYGDAAH